MTSFTQVRLGAVGRSSGSQNACAPEPSEVPPYPAWLLTPGIKGGVGNGVLAAELTGRNPGFSFVEDTDDLFIEKTLLHGDVFMWLLKTWLTSRCVHQRRVDQYLDPFHSGYTYCGPHHSVCLNVYQLSLDSGGSSWKITDTKKPARLTPCGLSGLHLRLW